MPLPNSGMSFTPFDPLPASDLNDIVENIEAIADGSGLEDGAVGPDQRGVGTVLSTVTSTRTTTSSSFASLTENLVVDEGTWEIYFAGNMSRVSSSQLTQTHSVSLSTSGTTETNTQLTALFTWLIPGSTDDKNFSIPFCRMQIVTLASQTTFTMIGKTSAGTLTIPAGAVIRARKVGFETS